MELLIILALIILNGVFAMSEMAVVSSRSARLSAEADEGNEGAEAALKLTEEPTQFLSTVQIGITLIGILAGALGGAALTVPIAEWIRATIPWLTDAADAISVVLVVGLTTYLSLVIGELVPKRLALQNPEKIASRIAQPMALLSRLAAPLVHLLTYSTRLLLRLLGVSDVQAPRVSELEVLSLVRMGVDVGIFDAAEEDMVEGVMRLDDQRISAVITPRTEIIWIDTDDDTDEIREKILGSPFATYPVARGSMDQVIGVVHSKDLLVQLLSGGPIDLEAAMRQPLFIPETVTVADVIKRFKAARVHTALIVGERGGIEGLVRLHDIIEEVFGDLGSGDLYESEAVQREDGSWLLDGKYSVQRLEAILPDLQMPEDESGDYETLAGFVMTRLGRVPSAGEYFDFANYRFEVVDMDDIRVDKVLVQPIAAPDK